MTESDQETVDTRNLLTSVGMLDESGKLRRSRPLSNPASFHELARRLFALVDREFDVIVVRDLFSDHVLGYELGLMAGCPVIVSHDREGLIELDQATRPAAARIALIAADTHFTAASIQAAALGLRQAGIQVAGAAVLLEQLSVEYDFPIWALLRVPTHSDA